MTPLTNQQAYGTATKIPMTPPKLRPFEGAKLRTPQRIILDLVIDHSNRTTEELCWMSRYHLRRDVSTSHMQNTLQYLRGVGMIETVVVYRRKLSVTVWRVSTQQQTKEKVA